MDFRIVIPSRYASVRLPGKPLRKIHDRTMIEWVYRAAEKSGANRIVVATDHRDIADAVETFGGEACLTRETHPSGTDRILEVCQALGWSDNDVVVNLQGDEPLMPAQNIVQVANNLVANPCDMSTLHKPISAESALDPNQVKLVHDAAGMALFFSRAPIPYERNSGFTDYKGHIGIYAYQVGFLRRFSRLPPGELEQTESLEQLRALENGFKIHTQLAEAQPGPGIDTEQDLLEVSKLMESMA
ncbi:MAG: 3-deoxy-manno-octulosonate cytidylyltransferase [Pseudomonadota bacterium]